MTAKSELQAKRETLLEELSKFMRSLRIVEKDNYELDRVMYILNAENDRLRAVSSLDVGGEDRRCWIPIFGSMLGPHRSRRAKNGEG